MTQTCLRVSTGLFLLYHAEHNTIQFSLVSALGTLSFIVPPSEPLPSEIKYNPFEEWLICLSFCYTQSQFLPPQRIYHVTSESEHLKDPMTYQ